MRVAARFTECLHFVVERVPVPREDMAARNDDVNFLRARGNAGVDFREPRLEFSDPATSPDQSRLLLRKDGAQLSIEGRISPIRERIHSALDELAHSLVRHAKERAGVTQAQLTLFDERPRRFARCLTRGLGRLICDVAEMSRLAEQLLER